MSKIARAYELQETLKKDRQQLKTHEEEYKRLMDQIISSKVKQLGSYEVVEKVVQKKRFIISDKFRERWPELFNQLAKVTLKSARERINDEELEEVCGVETVTKPIIAMLGATGQEETD